MPKRVLPQPGPPQTRVGRPFGRPPQVISSSPWMPVGHLGSVCSWAIGDEVSKTILEAPTIW